MRTSRLPVVLLALAATLSCAHEAPVPPRTMLAADGASEFAAGPDAVRAAANAALHGIGYEVVEDPAAPDVVRTVPRKETVPRWRWLQEANPGAHDAAAVGASVARGQIPVDPHSSVASTPSETEVLVAYTLTLTQDESGTLVTIHPHATVEGREATDDFLAVLGAEDARHRWQEMFDAIRMELERPPPTPEDAPVPAG